MSRISHLLIHRCHIYSVNTAAIQDDFGGYNTSLTIRYSNQPCRAMKVSGTEDRENNREKMDVEWDVYLDDNIGVARGYRIFPVDGSFKLEPVDTAIPNAGFLTVEEVIMPSDQSAYTKARCYYEEVQPGEHNFP